MGKSYNTYFEIHCGDDDKVTEFLERMNIDYDIIESDNVLDFDEVKLEDADTELIIDTLLERCEEYDLCDISELFASRNKETKKDVIRFTLGLNNIADVEDVVSEVRELFK